MAAGSVVIVGAGQAGVQTAASLREAGFDGRVVLIGDEPGLPYERPPLSKAYVEGTVARSALALRPAQFFADKAVELMAGERVVEIDRAERRVWLASGEAVGYGHLVLATGVRNRPLAVPGADLDGVLSLRTAADAELIRERAASVRQVVIVGAGFIGLELAAVLARRGVEVEVIEAAARAMGRGVTPLTAAHVVDVHAQSGVRLSFSTCVDRIVGPAGRVCAVETTDGRSLPAELVIVAIGVLPNTDLAAAAGLPCDNGISVDAQLSTIDPAISAIGDCASFPSRRAGSALRLESVQNAIDQARCVAARLTGNAPAYDALPWFWSDQGDLRLQMTGLHAGCDRTVVRGDMVAGSFSVFCFRDESLVALESVNRPADQAPGRRLLALADAQLTPEQAADEAYDLRAHLKRRQAQLAA
jgi:3-phenylpropionate/trans-cinnamate dioxygenase ferredoxin reductase subunit